MTIRATNALAITAFFGWALLALVDGCSPPPGAWLCNISDEIPPPLAVRGANLVGFQSSEYVGEDAPVFGALRDFGGVGGNWSAINVWWFQDSIDSEEITPDPQAYTISDAAVSNAISAAHAAGLQVLLRPVVDVRDGAWRARIRPSARWFQAYGEFVMRFARMAADQQVAALSVGVELTDTQPSDLQWRQLVFDVRQVYAGRLVYCANCDAVANVSWWDAVDVVGVDAWYAVAPIAGADVRLMACGWSYWLDQLAGQLVGCRPGQPVWLTEAGTMAAWGSPRVPSCYAGACPGVNLRRVDLDEQATFYRAALLATAGRPWVEGVFWWSWYADPEAAYVRAQDYSPQGKPAQQVLQEFWNSADD